MIKAVAMGGCFSGESNLELERSAGFYTQEALESELLIMVVRLPIVLIHTRPPSAAGERMVDQLVGELIGLPGFDLVSVEPLSSLSDDATDRLTLESLQGDTVILDWNAVEDVLACWRDLGLSGSRSPHQLDLFPIKVPPGQRRVYLIDLRNAGSASAILSALGEIQAGLKVKTVQLGGLGGKSLIGPYSAVHDSRQDPTLGRSQSERQRGSVGDELKRKSVTASQAFETEPMTKTSSVQSRKASKNKLDLDLLVDDLDRSDL